MPRRDFTNIPRLPDTGNASLNNSLNAMLENIELLCGLRGDVRNHAVVKGDIVQDYPADSADVGSLTDTVRKLMVNLKE